MWPAQGGVMHEVRRNPRQRKPRGKKAHDKAIEAQRRYKDRHQLDAVLSALVSTYLYDSMSMY
jgi:IS30 family transposase